MLRTHERVVRATAAVVCCLFWPVGMVMAAEPPAAPSAGIDGVRLQYAADGTTTVTDALGHQTFYALSPGEQQDPARKVTGRSDNRGTESYDYTPVDSDPARRVSTSQDRSGVRTTYAYSEISDSPLGAVSVTARTEAVGTPQQRVSETRTSMATNRLLQQTIGAQETTLTRNARHQPTVITVRDTATDETRVTTQVYCDAISPECPQIGLLLRVDGPRTDVADTTTFAYYTSDDAGCATGGSCAYRKGDLRRVTNALGHVVETLAYDPSGHPLSIQEANGVVTDYTYHARGWLTSVTVRGATTAEDRVTQISYWPTGQVQQITEPDGSSVTY
ncbi:RHS repeat protein, partial [Stenotrophomonas sp. S41]|nr:RHS repeat protein [Stenotrophomonas sp. S41]